MKKSLRLKKSTSVLGDAFEVLASLPDHSFDVCIADPPYNMSKKRGLSWAFSRHVTMQENWDRFSEEDYVQFSTAWMKEMIRLLKPNGNLLVFGSYHNIYTLGVILQQLDRIVLNSIIWTKPNAQPNITCRTLTESTEQIIWACNGTKDKATQWTFNYAQAKTLNEGKQMRNTWSFPVTSRSERVAGHPSQKPEALIERLVLLFSKRGDWILDPFAGVGTTGVAAQKHDRYSLLIENQPRYIEAQKSRLSKLGFLSQFSFIEAPKKAKAPALKAKKASRSSAKAPSKSVVSPAPEL